MNLRIIESNLNLRVEQGKTNTDYKLEKTVAIDQMNYKDDIDVYCNVEYMECQDEEYLYEFRNNYKRITALFKNSRGILCYVDKRINTKVIAKYDKPHFLHFRITKEKAIVDIIVFRILSDDSSIKDFMKRKNNGILYWII